MKKLRFLLVGPGRLGTSLAAAWVGAGHVCAGVRGGTAPARARAWRLMRRRAPRAGGRPPAFDLLLIAVPDREVSRVARSWAKRGSWEGRFALHTSGVLRASVLAPLRAQGASVGALHPLVSIPFPDPGPGLFRGIYFGVEGDPEASRWARRLARDAGGRSLEIRATGKARYHLGACLASGYLLALLDAAASRIAAGSADPALLRRAFLALAESTLRNARARGIEAALTGPILREDVVSVRAHGQALARLPAVWRALYRGLAAHTLDLAARSGRIRPSSARRIRRVLEVEETE
ncbi:MAG TPA: Rossmann-like and DUF2520 domain-containing protein [Candidatus Polarisedimenticolia bacterium]|jgi:predicted short-subunit dehydrogenase-like oxidoreductase (DUF2520 family)|nr:Rossmann-like and DUF2520 domain-containing protein [Candidatus Polarisedimenticolia bacterium]